MLTKLVLIKSIGFSILWLMAASAFGNVTLEEENDSPIRIFVGADAGTSFSPHGVGYHIGLNYDQLRFKLGYGVHSKLNLLGNPISLGSSYEFSNGLQLGLSINHYQGRGRRYIAQEHSPQDLGETSEVEPFIDLQSKRNIRLVSWQLMYTQITVGKTLWSFKDHLFLDATLGCGINVYSKIKTASNDGYDRYGDNKAIDIEKEGTKIFPFSSGAGKGDFGFFASLGLSYVL